MSQATAIIVGASSLVSREIAKQLAEQGVELALLAQDTESLKEFSQSLPTQVSLHELAIERPKDIIATLESIWQQLGGAHLVIVNTGLNGYDASLPWQLEQDIITVNVQGYSAICNTAFRLFVDQGYGQLAAINSIAGLRGGPSVAYHASKAYASSYLEGLSMHAQRLKLPITISDLQLGLLDKAAMQQSRLWLSPPHEVARQALKAIDRKSVV